jgi:uncharacterized membrane protein YphA (DoxX/SURF4 family)
MIYLTFISRALLALVFIASAAGKSRHPGVLQETIRKIGFPSRLARIAGPLVISYEAIEAALFALGIFPQLASVGVVALLLVFIAISFRAFRSQQVIPCNCFGASETPLGMQTLARAVLLLLPASIYAVSTWRSTSAWWPTTFEVALPLLGLVIGAMLLARWLLAVEAVATYVVERRQAEDQSK